MMEFGKTLRLAREAKGYTVVQVAELTKMAPSTVAELEDENFSRIAAPIYGRGFVKLYCEAVGLDPKPLIEEFMSIYRGDRSSGIREHKVSEHTSEHTAPEPPPPPPIPTQPPPAPPPLPPQDTSERNLFSEAPETPVADEQVPPAVDPFAPQEEPGQEQRSAQRTISRYAAPVRTMHMPSVPPNVWRIAILGTLALLILWGIAAGVRALYRATTSDDKAGAVVEEAAQPQPPPAAETATAPAPKPAAPVAKPAAPAAKPPAAKPTPAKPAATKPAPAKPAAVKPAPVKPAAAKPAPTKPAAKPAPAKAKPAKTTRRTAQKIPSLYSN